MNKPLLEVYRTAFSKYMCFINFQMEDTLWSSLTDSYAKLPMALTAEKLAEQYGITRHQCDEFALSSQQRWTNGSSFVFHPVCINLVLY